MTRNNQSTVALSTKCTSITDEISQKNYTTSITQPYVLSTHYKRIFSDTIHVKHNYNYSTCYHLIQDGWSFQAREPELFPPIEKKNLHDVSPTEFTTSTSTWFSFSQVHFVQRERAINGRCFHLLLERPCARVTQLLSQRT